MRHPERIAPFFLLPPVLAAVPALYAAPTHAPRRVASGPAQAVTAFLKFHLSHSAGLTPSVIAARKQWLAPTLVRLLEREMTREAAFRAKHPDDVPFIDSDVFLSSQEIPESFKVAAPVGRDVPVRFRYGSTVRTVRYRMRLVSGRSGRQWQIDDVIADGESLQTTLRRPDYEDTKQRGGKPKGAP